MRIYHDSDEPRGFRPYRFTIHVENEADHAALQRVLHCSVNVLSARANEPTALKVAQSIDDELNRCGW